MSLSRRWLGCAVALVGLGYHFPAASEILVTGQEGRAEAFSDEFGGASDEDSTEDFTLFTAFTGSLSANSGTSGTGGTAVQYSVSRSPSLVTVGASVELSANSGTGKGLSNDCRAGAGFQIDFTITDEAVQFVFNATVTPTGEPGGFDAEAGYAATLLGSFPGFQDTHSCGASTPDGCVAEEFHQEITLEPGTYSFTVNEDVFARNGKLGLLVSSWDVTIGAPPACELTWDEALGGTMEVATNWSPEGVPFDDGSGCSNLIVALPGDYAIAFGTLDTNSLVVRMGSPVFTGTELSLSGVSQLKALGIGSGGEFILEGGTVNAARVVVGDIPGGDGESAMRVRNDGTVLTSREAFPSSTPLDLIIGSQQDAAVEITDGAAVSAARVRVGTGSALDGKVTIDGVTDSNPALLVASTGVRIGDGGNGIVTVKNGGRLSTLNSGVLLGAGGDASLVVGGQHSGSALKATADIGGALELGGAGLVVGMVVEDGGVVMAESLEVGIDGSGTVFVSGGNTSEPTPAMEIAGVATIGGAHTGEVIIENGGSLHLDSARIGITMGGSGLVHVGPVPTTGPRAGEPTLFVASGAIEVGSSDGRGRLELMDGGFASCVFLDVPFGTGAQGELELSTSATSAEHSRLEASGAVKIGVSGPGSVRILGASTLTSDVTVDVGSKGVLRVFPDGGVTSPVVRIVAAGGSLIGVQPSAEKGDAATAPTITGDLELLAGGKLTLETTGGTAPAMEVTGDADLAGTLEVLFPAEKALMAGAIINLLSVQGTVSGDFDEATFPTRSDAFDGTFDTVNGVLQLTVVNPGTAVVDLDPADINGDSAVNAVDVQLAINAALGISVAPFSGDVNGDSAANAVDVQLVINAALGL